MCLGPRLRISQNNPFAGKRMGRHIKRQNQTVYVLLGYALGPYGLGYGLGCGLGRRLVYEWTMEHHKENK